MSGTSLRILYLLYPGFNTLDVNGPLDVLCNYALRMSGPGPFTVTTACFSQDGFVQAYEHITIKADITFAEATKGITDDEKYDILMVPGAGPGYIKDMIAANDPILGVIQTFLENDNKNGSNKWLVSICTGALLCGAAGGFKGLNATTHWSALQSLVDYCNSASAPAKSVTRQRWVDGGCLPPATEKKYKTRVLSSGGISCGLDACLYLLKVILGTGPAYDVAAMMDYVWNVEWTTPANNCWTPPANPLLPYYGPGPATS